MTTRVVKSGYNGKESF